MTSFMTTPQGRSCLREARKEEIKFMQDWKVWEVRTIEECKRVTGKAPIGGRWVGHNKGDADSPKIRCRYVAKDIARWRDGAMCAATPPLEAVRLLLSDLATRRRSGDRRKTGQRKALVIDVSKAHLHAFVKRGVYVALPLRSQNLACAPN